MGVGKGKTLIYSICFMKICNNEYIALVFLLCCLGKQFNNILCMHTHSSLQFWKCFPMYYSFYNKFYFYNDFLTSLGLNKWSGWGEQSLRLFPAFILLCFQAMALPNHKHSSVNSTPLCVSVCLCHFGVLPVDTSKGLLIKLVKLTLCLTRSSLG